MSIKTRNCPICDKSEASDLSWFIDDPKRCKPSTSKLSEMEIRHSNLVLCEFCGTVYFNQYPDSLNNLYTENYRKEGEFEVGYRLNENKVKNVLFFRNIQPFLKLGGSVLDVGCSEGFFVGYLNRMGMKAEGLEINKSSVDYGTKKWGITIYPYEITKHAKKYDFVFTSGYFEHLENPKAVLEHIRDNCLNDDGCIHIGVPDLNCPNQVFLSEYFPPEHLQTFSVDSLVLLMKSTGFEPEQIIMDNYNHGISIVARKVRDYSDPVEYRGVAKANSELGNIYQKYNAFRKGSYDKDEKNPFLRVSALQKSSIKTNHTNQERFLLALKMITYAPIDMAARMKLFLDSEFKRLGVEI